MLFRQAALMIEGWLAAGRRWRSLRAGRLAGIVADVWLALPGDVMARLVMWACGIPAPTRSTDAAGTQVLVVEDARAAHYLDRQWIPVAAQTLGRYVFSRQRLSDHSLAHEVEHVRQWQRLGPLFLPAYATASGLALLRRRHPYWDNRFEAWARARANADVAALGKPD